MNKVETIIIVYVCIRFLFANSVRDEYYTEWKGYKFHSNTRPIRKVTSFSAVRCSMKCLVTPACVAAKFDTTNGDCEFHQVYNVQTPIRVVTENSSVVVVKSELQVDVLIDSWMKYGALDCYIGSSHDYTGTHSKTISNRECQGWNKNYTHTVNDKPINQDDHSTNYCRASSSDGLLWCYTTDPAFRWEYCPIIPCFACGVFESLPSELPNTTWAVSITHVLVVTFQCVSVTLGKSVEHCPASLCGSDDQWSSMYNISCTSEDCYTNSTEYVGKVHCTVSGITCQHWNTDIPHKSNYRPTDPNDLASNYCRDLSSTGRPWCYTTHPDVIWEFCPVPRCPE
ncbi:plasminogen-like [Mytilus galloprovincialis]|uniref:plasminogen-like n=1 Tax=Mytilus galloprovincialis TaxID=29158 RepID=UPI003F7B4370